MFVSNSVKTEFIKLFGDDFKDQQLYLKYSPVIGNKIVKIGNKSLNDITKSSDKPLLVRVDD